MPDNAAELLAFLEGRYDVVQVGRPRVPTLQVTAISKQEGIVTYMGCQPSDR